MTDSIETNAPQVAKRLRGAAGQMRREIALELRGLSGRVASRMRLLAPQWRSTLAGSVREERVSDLEWIVRPTASYAINVEKGRKPGKGLPRFFDPAAGSAVAWLESRLTAASRAVNAKFRPGRVGSRRRTAAEIELRDRYFAWSRHVKLHGIKPHPFVKPTADEFRPLVGPALLAALRRGVARSGGGAAS